MAETKKLNLKVSAGTASVWRVAAETLGYVAESGTQMGQGSISGLLAAVAAGKVTVVDLAEALRVGMGDDAPSVLWGAVENVAGGDSEVVSEI